MIYGTIGTLSHGTMRSVDLLDTFTDELERLTVRNIDGGHLRGRDAGRYFAIVAAARVLIADNAQCVTEREHEVWDEAAAECVNALFDVLGEFAPPICYFGAHAGDGSDYGMWCDMDAIDEACADGECERRDERGADLQCVVNDHGNVTLYAVTYREMWSVV